MDTQVSPGVPVSQSRMWSQMARTADSAGDSWRSCGTGHTAINSSLAKHEHIKEWVWQHMPAVMVTL
jgi:hypothetical protein